MLLKSLRKHDANLANLHTDFFTSISNKGVLLYSFYETMPTRLFNCISLGVRFREYSFEFGDGDEHSHYQRSFWVEQML
ncbi:MAG: hypothetical protein M1816_005589 [Peltula sp. TS41687]|nr:MAG: hypothetical protein M1816_005589 [Peltula sp. TS41687]